MAHLVYQSQLFVNLDLGICQADVNGNQMETWHFALVSLWLHFKIIIWEYSNIHRLKKVYTPNTPFAVSVSQICITEQSKGHHRPVKKMENKEQDVPPK